LIRIGVAGWKYKDWEGIVYPAKPRLRGFDELAYISGYFDAVEINSSFYGAPRPSSAKKWVESVADNSCFRFTAKMFHSFTHERKPAPNDEKDFKNGIAPLIEAGRFGALLIQFPWSFKNAPENREYLVGLQKRFQEYPLVVEVRHGSWIEDDILDLFSDLGIGICNIDQPLFHRSVKPAAYVTSTIGYVRLHGRNYRQWQVHVWDRGRRGALRPDCRWLRTSIVQASGQCTAASRAPFGEVPQIPWCRLHAGS
jgi:uncharacterized protein YecE (DUF72 family)